MVTETTEPKVLGRYSVNEICDIVFEQQHTISDNDGPSKDAHTLAQEFVKTGPNPSEISGPTLFKSLKRTEADLLDAGLDPESAKAIVAQLYQIAEALAQNAVGFTPLDEFTHDNDDPPPIPEDAAKAILPSDCFPFGINIYASRQFAFTQIDEIKACFRTWLAEQDDKFLMCFERQPLQADQSFTHSNTMNGLDDRDMSLGMQRQGWN